MPNYNEKLDLRSAFRSHQCLLFFFTNPLIDLASSNVFPSLISSFPL